MGYGLVPWRVINRCSPETKILPLKKIVYTTSLNLDDHGTQVDRSRRLGFHALWCHPGAAVGDDDVPLGAFVAYGIFIRKKIVNRKGMVCEIDKLKNIYIYIYINMYTYIYISMYTYIYIYRNIIYTNHHAI